MTKGIKVKKVIDNTPAVKKALQGTPLGKAVMAGALAFGTKVKISMSARSHSGKVYGKHRASAPGETPSVDTANLVNSIAMELVEVTATSAEANIGTGVEYGYWLEYGTERMEARPFMRPVYDENGEEIQSVVRQILKSALEGAV
jgi:HK97 gp10 family phage protein